MRRVALAFALLALMQLPATAAEVEHRTFALIIGYNGRPPGTTDESVQPLRYADDDALAFYQLQRELGAEAILLTVPDAETRQRYPQIVDAARPPTLDELRRSIGALSASMDAAARKGATPTFILFYSGHGARDGNGEAALALQDGSLSQSAMYEQVLDRISAPAIHLLIDACHAEAVVRPRDVDARTVDIRTDDLVEHLSRTRSIRYPHVGLVVASSSGASTHEWDLYQSGVFTHEVISALRGAADVNHDGRVEYSELAAFLAAANREVVDPRARVASVIQPPLNSSHEALSYPSARPTIGWLTGIPPTAGRFFIEDRHGNRILDGHAEPGFLISVAVPPDEILFLRNQDEEAELQVKAGAEAKFGTLAFHSRPLRARGAMETSLREGLFLMPYGPAYYSGYVDRADGSPAPTRAAVVEAGPTSHAGALTWTLRGGSAAFLATSALFGVFAWNANRDFESTSYQRQASDANDRFKLDTGLAIGFAASSVACAAASYFIDRRP